jgi:hypothetical protein
MKQAKLNIEFVIDKAAPATADQMRKWNELYRRLLKKPKSADKASQNENKRVYKTCGFFRVRQVRKEFFCASFVPQTARSFIDAKSKFRYYEVPDKSTTQGGQVKVSN